MMGLPVNGGTIRATGSTTSNAALDHAAIAIDAGHKVDGIRPTLVTTGAAAPTASPDGTQVILTFSETIGSVNRTKITIRAGGNVVSTIGQIVTGTKVFLEFTTALTNPSTTLTVELAAGAVEDAAGNENLALALAPPSNPRPSAPRNLVAIGGDEQVALTWDAPEDDGGFAITDYEVRIDGKGRWISIGSTDTTYTVTGLVSGTEYTFEVRAVNRNGTSRASNRAEATTLEALDFAHFANGEGSTSDFVFVNVSPHMTRPTLYFYDQEGQLMDPESGVDVTGDLRVTEDGALTVQTEMEALGELTISTHGRGDLVAGSVRVVSGDPIGGFLRFDLPGIGVAGVGASPPVRDALFPARRQAGGIRTAAALHNLGEEAITVSCRLMSGAGYSKRWRLTWRLTGRRPGTSRSCSPRPIRPTSWGWCAAPGRAGSLEWPWNWMPPAASSPRCRWCR